MTFKTARQLHLAMSSATTPITAELFALAIKDLPASSLHYKARELRNSIAHLDYSNQQLLPYTDGTNGEPDPDCVDAIKENEIVIERHNERLGLLKIEVEGRGMNWREFLSAEELEAQQNDTHTDEDMVDGEGNLVNGYGRSNGTSGTNVTSTTNGAGSRATPGTETTSSPWTNGTFVTGTIRGGNISIDSQDSNGHNRAADSINEQQPRRLTDEQLRQAVAQWPDVEEDDGLHL